MKKLRNWLIDSYNGIFPILKPSLPRRGTFLGLVFGILIGLAWAYVIAPTVYYDADPSTLQRGWQDEWVSLLAERYGQAASIGVPSPELEAEIVNRLSFVENPTEVVDRLGITAPGFRTLAEQAEPGRAAPKPDMVSSIVPFIVAPIVVIVLVFILSILWGLLIRDLLVTPIIRRLRGGAAVSDEATQKTIDAIRAAREAEKAAQGTVIDSALGEPVTRKMSVYIAGRGQYDDSFSIEDSNDMFLGECGATIAETVRIGDSEKVTAVEVWLFDKDDFVRTITKVFVSDHAANDPAIRARLETKGDLVLIQPNAIAILETSSLRMQVRVVDMIYGTLPPPNSYFERFTLELAVWQRPAGAAVPAAPSPAYAPSVPQSYTPPAAAPQPYSTPLPQAMPPAAPPPAPLPRREDDDPFGGTGDFTPIGGS